MIEIFKEFTFDAAHHLARNVPPGHAYAGLHGHSFRVEVHLRGEPDPKTGWIADLGTVQRALDGVRDRLDHRLLNDIPGLEQPTLETLARWIWQQLRPGLPALRRIVVRRGSLGEGCVYEPDAA
jgi:6-pyruvoyltetrahydropterin/6-carboxytetrahydropterin synthase